MQETPVKKTYKLLKISWVVAVIMPAFLGLMDVHVGSSTVIIGEIITVAWIASILGTIAFTPLFVADKIPNTSITGQITRVIVPIIVLIGLILGWVLIIAGVGKFGP